MHKKSLMVHRIQSGTIHLRDFSTWGQGQSCLPELPFIRRHSCNGFFATHTNDVTVFTEAFLGRIHTPTVMEFLPPSIFSS